MNDVEIVRGIGGAPPPEEPTPIRVLQTEGALTAKLEEIRRRGVLKLIDGEYPGAYQERFSYSSHATLKIVHDDIGSMAVAEGVFLPFCAAGRCKDPSDHTFVFIRRLLVMGDDAQRSRWFSQLDGRAHRWLRIDSRLETRYYNYAHANVLPWMCNLDRQIVVGDRLSRAEASHVMHLYYVVKKQEGVMENVCITFRDSVPQDKWADRAARDAQNDYIRGKLGSPYKGPELD